MQWLDISNPYTIWNWDDQHKFSVITGKVKKDKDYIYIVELVHSIRNNIWNSPISMAKYKKYLKSINELYIKFQRDIDFIFYSASILS